jgi:hypothetical protein
LKIREELNNRFFKITQFGKKEEEEKEKKRLITETLD